MCRVLEQRAGSVTQGIWLKGFGEPTRHAVACWPRRTPLRTFRKVLWDQVSVLEAEHRAWGRRTSHFLDGLSWAMMAAHVPLLPPHCVGRAMVPWCGRLESGPAIGESCRSLLDGSKRLMTLPTCVRMCCQRRCGNSPRVRQGRDKGTASH
jgi:hypothetical protein